MGLFDSIVEKFQQAGLETQSAQMDAESWDPEMICRKLQRTSSIAKCSGYTKALRAKCRELSDYHLKEVFDEAYDRRNAKACNAMMVVMEERDLAYKDDDGRIVRKYH